MTKIVLLLVLSGTPAADLLAADGSAVPPFRFYSTVDGLTQSEVTDIDQDRAGYLWFTTRRGLNRYDGREFDHYTIADGLRTNDLTALFVDADNSIWVGDARGGIAVIRASRVAHTIEPINNSSTSIMDIVSIGDRIFALADGAGILEVLTDGTDYWLQALGGESIGAKAMIVHERSILIAATSGLYQFDPGRTFELQQLSDSIELVHVTADGTIWVASEDNEVGIWKNGELQVRAIIDTTAELISLVSSVDGTVWIATRNELFKFDGTRPGSVQTGNSITKYEDSNEITSLFIDAENTLWLASESRLIRFLGDRFRHYALKTESDSETVWAISEDDRGRLWFGTQSKLLVREADESLAVVGTNRGVPRGAVRDIVTGTNGEIWAGIRGKGLYVVDTTTLTGKLISQTEGLEILDVALASDKAIWFSTFASGVFRYSPEDDVLSVFAPPSPTSVYTLDIWEDNSVWYAADDVGIVHLIPQDDGSYKQELFESHGELRNRLFNHVRVIGNEQLWVATEEGGLYQFESGKFTEPGADAPWADQTVYLIEILDNGTVVIGGEQGLYQFVPGSSAVAHYNQLSGFLGMETNVHAAFVDSEKYLWIGTVHGATRMDSTLPMPGLREPTPQIISMETGLDRLTVEDNAEVAPSQQGVHVEFAAISLLNSRGIEYSYQLIGMADEWGPPTTNRSVNFSRMPPGTFEFIVRARQPGGEWSREPASRHFTIQPYFWQKPWFRITAIIVVLVAFGIATRYRTRIIARQNEKLRAQVDERTRSIEMAKQHLQVSNEKLSCEIEERQKSEKARREMETRFRRAFENAPIGMALLDVDGYLFDVNPVLSKMLWPDAEPPAQIRFADLLSVDDREEFVKIYERLKAAELDDCEKKFTSRGDDGSELRILINLSSIRSDTDELLYTVLQVQDVTEARRLNEQLKYQASYDDLTGLLNRRSFEAELELACEEDISDNTPSYLMYMDLDQFKVVNDTSGHAAGDQLLRNVGDLLHGIVRTNDVVARLGGDEFGIILRKCPTAVAKRIAETIRQSIENLRFPWGSEIYRIGISIGGLPIDPTIGDVGELQQLADAACYAAKEAGRNCVHMVDGDKDTALVRRGQVRWVQRLREAMDNNRFALYGQEIRSLAENSNEPERLEILLRLRDPATRKLIPPGAFLPAAERYGLSIELDQWVVRNLLDMLFVHQSVATEYRQYWVNLSGTSVGDKRFAGFLIDAMRDSPLPRGTVNFEITETAVIRSVVEAGNLMTRLRAMGCEFALDDFGSGLSSFGYLKKLPVDYLKIDGMFTRDILTDKTNQIFVKSIIDIAHTLNIKTIAEFVECADMLELMRELGADYVQGFEIGRPYPIAPSFPLSGEFAAQLPQNLTAS
jgi:diguanylate cyclase (GGDEF)-like protein/PAS domain S-box-containing protein